MNLISYVLFIYILSLVLFVLIYMVMNNSLSFIFSPKGKILIADNAKLHLAKKQQSYCRNIDQGRGNMTAQRRMQQGYK